MISIRSPLVVAAVVLAAALATVATAHKHHDKVSHGRFNWNFAMWNDGKQTPTEAFKDCLCWDKTTDNWCHHEHDGKHTGFWRDSCQRVVAVNTMWWIPALLWCMYLCLTPLLVCAFRLCCNCCGGRTPSFGCCCPISNRVLSPDPKWVRPYSKCATWTAKVLAILVLVATIQLCVRSYIFTNNVRSAVQQGATDVQSDIDATITEIQGLATKAKKYAGEPWMGVDANMTDTVQSAIPTLTQASKDVADAPKHVDRQHRGGVLAIVSIPLVIITIVTVLGLCNVRSWPISISAGVISFYAVVLVIFGSAIMSVSIGVNLVCDHTDTVTTFAEDVLEAHEYCNQQRLTTAVNNTQIALARTLCMNGLQGMIDMAPKSKKSNTISFCDEKIGGMFRPSYAVGDAFTMQGPYIVDRLRLLEIINSAALARTNDGASITECGAASCKKMVEEISFVFGPSKDSLNSLMVKNSKCQIVAQQMQTVVQPLLCGSGNTDLVPKSFNFGLRVQNLGGCLLGLALVCTVAFWVWINGSKRFTKGAPKEELMGHHELMRQHQQALTYQQQQEEGAIQQPIIEAPKQAAPYVPHNAAVQATTQQPLLLNHSGPAYASYTAPDVNAAPSAKQQPEAI